MVELIATHPTAVRNNMSNNMTMELFNRDMALIDDKCF
jgi:hypothetical protein